MTEENKISDKEEYFEEEKRPSKALLIGVYTHKDHKDTCVEHLEELERLTDTYGFITLEKVPIFLRKFEASTFLTKGKMEEMQELAKSLDVNVVIFDDEIQPSQQRNLEEVFERTVMDRTEVILEVFGQRAQTKEAQIQIKLAKVRYQFPRLKRLWTHLERQAGGGSGGVFLKGMGEKQIEIDRRLLNSEARKLERALKEIKVHRETQRQDRVRTGIPTFAIVGYTNAGKSTLLNALTDAEVFVEDKLFATLDTTTRKFTLPNKQDILLVDTVGFIRKLPHTLVAAFRSTLEEAVQTDVLLHLIDVSHPMVLEQVAATEEVLKELKASDKPIITVFNKIDKCENLAIIDRLRIKFPRTVQISALKQEGFDDLMDLMVEELSKRREVVKIRVPQSQYDVVSEVMRKGRVINQDYEENDVLMTVEMSSELKGRVEEYIIPSQPV
ncbi:MAG: GTP-binding protein HflX [Chlamydiales bacterium]|jgi:GTP-binding protein HflX